MRSCAFPDAAEPNFPFNATFTFDTFIVGTCNRLAQAAARAVCEAPFEKYNPLFLYGGIGVGKTHLLHAMARELTVRHGHLRVVLTTSEQFTQEVVQCIRNDRMSQFCDYYRSADVLLIDDVQFFCNKGRTQEELSYTLNELQNRQRHVVLSSDAPPRDIPGLIERLRARFEGALLADIQPVDLETRMAILSRNAVQLGFSLPDDVRTLIALRTHGSVRQLEGVLKTLTARASLDRVDVTVPLAERVLDAFVRPRRAAISIDAIQEVVAKEWGISKVHLKGRPDSRQGLLAQQVGTYLAKELTEASLVAIGRAFGGKHYATVLHAINKIATARRADAALNGRIQSLVDQLQQV